MRTLLRILLLASATKHCCFGGSPLFEPTSRYLTMWTSYDGKAPHLPSPVSRHDWMQRSPKHGSQWPAGPQAARVWDERCGDEPCRLAAVDKAVASTPKSSRRQHDDFFLSQKTCEQERDERPACGSRALVWRACAHPDALGSRG